MVSQTYTQFIAFGEVYHGDKVPFSSYHIWDSGINISDDVEMDHFVKMVFVRFLP